VWKKSSDSHDISIIGVILAATIAWKARVPRTAHLLAAAVASKYMIFAFVYIIAMCRYFDNDGVPLRLM